MSKDRYAKHNQKKQRKAVKKHVKDIKILQKKKNRKKVGILSRTA